MKKGLGPYELVANVALIVTLIVGLIIVYPVLKEVFLQSEGKGECEIGIVLSAMLKKVSFGSAGDIPFGCKTKNVVITDKTISAVLEKNKEKDVYWATGKVVADEMVDCFNRAWRGKIDLKGINLKSLLSEDANELLCFVCARLEFDQSYFDRFNVRKPEPVLFTKSGQRPYWDASLSSDFMKKWLQNNNHEGKSYYDFLTGDLAPFYAESLGYTQVAYSTPLAVLYVIDFTGRGGIKLARYDSLTQDLGFSLFIDKYGGYEESGGVAKCAQAIG